MPPVDRVHENRILWVLLFLLAGVLWSVHITRPVDLPSWHEFDYCSIARNFLREGNNILYPRIDWRGDGPGFTEMEFPIIPWLMAQLYRVFGIHEIIGRLFSCTFMLLSLFVFARIACKLLPQPAALFASLFFIVNNVVIQVATAIQPESLMLLLYLMALYFFVTWYDRQAKLLYAGAVLCFAGAMLVKSPAAHLAIFFLLWALHKDGLKAFRRPSLYLFVALSFTPVIWWYSHAAGLWHTFHNSMGVSNEDHWLGLDLLRRPKVILNLISIDLLLVCGGGGVLLIWAAFRTNTAANQLVWRWAIAIAIYLLVIIRTAGAYWAVYYHIVAVPPMALLFGAGLMRWQASKPRTWAGCALAATALSGALLLGHRLNIASLPGVFQALLIARPSAEVLIVLIVLSTAVTLLTNAKPLLAAGCFTYLFISGQLLLGSWQSFQTPTAAFECAVAFERQLPPGVLIVASGGICSDQGGHRVANNAPNMFYWLDHKGFSTCQGQVSIAELKALSARNAQYFVADKLSFPFQPGFENDLRRTFRVISKCPTAVLFSLQPLSK